MATADVKQRIGRSDATPGGFDAEVIRNDFPALHVIRNGKPIVYLDNSATGQKPQQVIDRLVRYYTSENSNVHRGVHYLSQLATKAFEDARETMRAFINASKSHELIFTKGASEGMNLIAHSYGLQNLNEGDEVLITHLEHHSNIVPWQIVCEKTGATLRVVPIDDNGDLDMEAFGEMLSEKTKVVGVVHISNAIGTVNPVAKIVEMAHEVGAVVMVDGAQAAPHMALDMQAMDVDFYAIAGHKMYGPTGIGVLYGKEKLLDAMPPYQGGGSMILSVTFEKTTYAALPDKFEAGTPNIAGAVGLAAAADYMTAVGHDAIVAHEKELLAYGTDLLESIDGVHIIGKARKKAGVLSFIMDSAHPHDVGQVLDDEGVAVRAGHHCTQPLMDRFNIPATTRASFGLYNNKADLDAMAAAVRKVNEVFA